MALEQGGVAALAFREGLFQAGELRTIAIVPPNHDHRAGCCPEAHHLPSGIGAAGGLGIVPALGATLHLGGEEHVVTHADACFRPDLAMGKPPVLGFEELLGGGEAKLPQAEGADGGAVLGEATEVIDHAGKAMHLVTKGGEELGAVHATRSEEPHGRPLEGCAGKHL